MKWNISALHNRTRSNGHQRVCACHHPRIIAHVGVSVHLHLMRILCGEEERCHSTVRRRWPCGLLLLRCRYKLASRRLCLGLRSRTGKGAGVLGLTQSELIHSQIMDFGWTRSLKFVHQIFFPHGVLSALLRVFNPAMPDVNFDQNSMRTSIEVLLCRPMDGFLPKKTSSLSQICTGTN